MRLLVVEDEVRLAAALQRGLQAEGFTVDLAHDGEDGPAPGPGRATYDGRGAGHHAARPVRLPGVRAAAGRGELGAGADALGQGRRVRRGRRARPRRRRLPDQAVLVRGAGGQAAGAAAPRRAAAAGRAGRRRPVARPGAAPGHPRGDRDRADARGSSRCWNTCCAGPARSCPRSDILRNVWDPHHDGDLNVVEVYVGYLRRKIDAPFGRSALQTVRGAGYRLAADGG